MFLLYDRQMTRTSSHAHTRKIIEDYDLGSQKNSPESYYVLRSNDLIRRYAYCKNKDNIDAITCKQHKKILKLGIHRVKRCLALVQM